MPQITPALLLTFLTLLLSLSGCGDTDSKVVFSPDSGKHLSGWISGHKVSARADVESCRECHGENLDGGISLVSCMSPTAVSGFRCHATSPVGNPTGCVSCHGGPPNGPYGDTAPNRQNGHEKMAVLTGCNSCHLNAGTGTPGHASAAATKATVALSTAFRAKTITTTFGYADGKCSGVSCHGGKVTPAWSDSLDLVANDNSVCYSCHEQGTAPATPQYNSFYSGIKAGQNLHALHLQSTLQEVHCTDCHNIGILTDHQKHFGGINTNTFTAPGDTIGNKGSSLPTKIRNYNEATQTCSTNACHPDTTWTQP